MLSFVLGVVVGVALNATGADMSQDVRSACYAFADANNRPRAICDCVIEGIDGDAELAAEFMAILRIADPAQREAAASPELAAIVNNCRRQLTR